MARLFKRFHPAFGMIRTRKRIQGTKAKPAKTKLRKRTVNLMEKQDQLDAVTRMQQYIEQHMEQSVSLEEVARAGGYSIRHAKRIFREYTGKTLSDYIRRMQMTAAAKRLAEKEETILEVALSSQYESHEGFIKAFAATFGLTPSKYRKEKPPVPYFVPYPVKHQYFFRQNRGGNTMNKEINTCTATYTDRPKRKLIYQPSNTASDYMTYCQEKGCEWEGLLNSIEEKFDTAAILTLPEELAKGGSSRCAAGVEVPENYQAEIPEGYHITDLPAATMLYIQSQPYENEDDFMEAIETVYQAYLTYRPESFGYEYAPETAPAFNFGAYAASGARMAFPVKKK